jgi:hypothetical protein
MHRVLSRVLHEEWDEYPLLHGRSIILGRLQLVPCFSHQHKTDDTSVHGKSTARESFPSNFIVQKCLNINSINDSLFSPRLRNLLNWWDTFWFGPPILICVTPDTALLFCSRFLILTAGYPSLTKSTLSAFAALAQLKVTSYDRFLFQKNCHCVLNFLVTFLKFGTCNDN